MPNNLIWSVRMGSLLKNGSFYNFLNYWFNENIRIIIDKKKLYLIARKFKNSAIKWWSPKICIIESLLGWRAGQNLWRLANTFSKTESCSQQWPEWDAILLLAFLTICLSSTMGKGRALDCASPNVPAGLPEAFLIQAQEKFTTRSRHKDGKK